MRLFNLFLIFFFFVSFLSASPKPLIYSKIKNRIEKTGEFSALVIRVQFKEENNEMVTGNGLWNDYAPWYDYKLLFGIDDEESREKLNNIPFKLSNGDDAFQIFSLPRYFQEISNGKFLLTNIKVSELITLEKPLSFYGKNQDLSGNDISTKQLSILVHDVLAKVRNLYDLSLYDYIFIMHSGVGEEFSGQGKDGDIITGVVSAQDYYQNLGENMGSDIKAGGVAIIPQSEGDASENSYPPSTLGPTAFALGTLLGMPYTFDISGKSSGLGMWDLMSYGWLSYLGYLPMPPMGYTKILLGWDSGKKIFQLPYRVNSETGEKEYILSPFEDNILTDNRILRIDITSKEYFLLEYRALTGLDKYFHALKYIGKKNGKYIFENLDRSSIGVLIWHIDEDFIQKSFPYVNVGESKGIDLEEADGLNDLDAPINSPGSFGDLYDAFNQQNNTVFSFKSRPSSVTRNGAYSGVKIYNINVDEAEKKAYFSISDEKIAFLPRLKGNNFFLSDFLYQNGMQLYLYDGTPFFRLDADENLLFMDNFLVISNKHIIFLKNEGKELDKISDVSNYFIDNLEKVSKIDSEKYLFYGENGNRKIFEIYKTDGEQTLIEKNSGFYLDNNLLYSGNTVLYENVFDYFVYDGKVYTLREGVIYRDNKFLFSMDVSKFLPYDYDGDGVVEFFVLREGEVFVYNEKGMFEKKLSISSVSDFSLVKWKKTLYLLFLGTRSGLYNLENDKVLMLPGFNTRGLQVRSDLPKNKYYFIYEDEQYYYGFKLEGLSFAYLNHISTGTIEKVNLIHKKSECFLYPNPVSGDKITLRVFSSRSNSVANVKIYSASMKLLKNKSYPVISGENSLDINLSFLSKGVYFLFVDCCGEKRVLKFGKIR